MSMARHLLKSACPTEGLNMTLWKVKTAAALFVVLLVIAIPQSALPIAITGSANATALASAILDNSTVTLVPGSATIYGLGGAFQSATFTGGGTDVGFDTGIILSNGNATDIQNTFAPKSPEAIGAQNGDDVWSTGWNFAPATVNVSDLAALAGVTDIFDPSILQFSFNLGPGAWNLTFKYVFASDEYIDYIGSGFNDVFGLFIDGTNVGTLSNQAIVSVDSINPISNPLSYRNNVVGYSSLARQLLDINGTNPDYPSSNLNIAPDGLTTVLVTQTIALNGGTALNPTLHTARLAIGDVGNSNVDSAVFIQGSSFSATPGTPAVPEPGTMFFVGAGLVIIGSLRGRFR